MQKKLMSWPTFPLRTPYPPRRPWTEDELQVLAAVPRYVLDTLAAASKRTFRGPNSDGHLEWWVPCIAHADPRTSLTMTVTPEGDLTFKCRLKNCSHERIKAGIKARKDSHSKRELKHEEAE